MRIMKIMIPSIINLVLSDFISAINLVFAGRLGDERLLVGIGMANTLIACFPMMITMGISSSIETLVSQAYGQNQFKMCGTYLNK
jgi:Na+-driven multidrug efflux pump